MAHPLLAGMPRWLIICCLFSVSRNIMVSILHSIWWTATTTKTFLLVDKKARKLWLKKPISGRTLSWLNLRVNVNLSALNYFLFQIRNVKFCAIIVVNRRAPATPSPKEKKNKNLYFLVTGPRIAGARWAYLQIHYNISLMHWWNIFRDQINKLRLSKLSVSAPWIVFNSFQGKKKTLNALN